MPRRWRRCSRLFTSATSHARTRGDTQGVEAIEKSTRGRIECNGRGGEGGEGTENKNYPRRADAPRIVLRDRVRTAAAAVGGADVVRTLRACRAKGSIQHTPPPLVCAQKSLSPNLRAPPYLVPSTMYCMYARAFACARLRTPPPRDDPTAPSQEYIHIIISPRGESRGFYQQPKWHYNT